MSDLLTLLIVGVLFAALTFGGCVSPQNTEVDNCIRDVGALYNAERARMDAETQKCVLFFSQEECSILRNLAEEIIKTQEDHFVETCKEKGAAQ